MKQLSKLAWRNLWRNRRRTLITLASVLMAVILAIAIRSFQKGVYGNMIGNAVSFSTGYIQIHAKGYWDDQSINNSFEATGRVQKAINNTAGISISVPRLESFALASSGQHTKGVEVMGIDPGQEQKMNGLGKKIVQGQYLSGGEGQGILVGDGLAKYLHLQLGDTLILLGQGYHGTTAAGQYRIQGIFHYPLDQMNNMLVYLSLPDARSLMIAPNRLTSISLMLKSPNDIDKVSASLQHSLDSNWEVMQWPVMNKTLLQEIEGDNAGGLIMLGILYLVVAFGVFGTILMMTLERKKEFAVMIAIGMHRAKLISVVILETIFIGLLGILAGAVLVFPLVLYLHLNPIRLSGAAAQTYQQFGIEPVLPTSVDPHIFLYQGITVLCIALISALYPLWYINKFKLAETLKQ